jgi:hypothetical protein
MSDEQVLPDIRPPSSPLSRRERDFLLLNIFVLLRHGYVDRARILADAMYLGGDDTAEVHLARAVLRFSDSHWAEALESLDTLDRIDPIERFGDYRLNNKQRMRRYLKTRCLYELGDTARVRDALDSYLRHGDAGTEQPE